jgi:septum formation protein
MKIILGSESKWRQQTLRDMGFMFDVLNPNIDEKSIRFDDPEVLTLALANAKADALLPSISEPSLLITADQVIIAGGIVREKPQNAEEAREFLRSYASHPAESVSALVAVNTETGERRGGIDIARILFHPIPEMLIEEFIAEGDIFSYAGAFAVEDTRFKAYVKRIEGTIDSVNGLPKKLLWKLLKSVAPDIKRPHTGHRRKQSAA